MKKILVFPLFSIIVISTAFLTVDFVQAVGCGSGDVVNPTLAQVNSAITCTSPSDSVEGYYYYFYLASRQEVHFIVTSQPVNWQVSFALSKKDEWSSKLVPASGSKNIRTGLWGDEKWVIDAGYWEILVLPNPTRQSDDFSGSFQSISSFSLSITTTQQPTTYCGDSFCNGGETCSSCPSDCGSCTPIKKSDGSFCSSASECSGGCCVYGKCRSSSSYCGDNYCDGDETCLNCSSDCGACASVKKPIDSHCSNSSECESGYCAMGLCISASYCGNGSCDPWEDCSFCSRDCPVCTTKKYGETCSMDKECLSDYCHSTEKICCNASAWGCCREASECGDKSRFICENFTCILRQETTEAAKKADGEYCDKNKECTSGNCQNNICCEWGQKCAEKPSGAAEPASPAPPTTTEAVNTGEIIVISSSDLSLNAYETQELLITIQNKSQKEIILGDYLLIKNPIPVNIDIQKSALQIYKKKLLSGETISTESQGGQRETIEKMTFMSLRQGSGTIKLKAVYFVDNQAKWVEKDLAVSVSASYTQKEETASQMFNETMLWEGREVDYSASGTEKEYIFVGVEDKSLQQAAINDWQAANNQMEEAVANLKDDFTGVVKPEVLSFFETIKSLEEAKSSQEITETSIRALAPPAIIAGFDFANLLDAIDKQKKLERGLLTHFNATDFVIVPIHDSQRNITGYTKAIVEEKNGKFYAIKIGDL